MMRLRVFLFFSRVEANLSSVIPALFRRSGAFISAVDHRVGDERDITFDVNGGQGSGLGHFLLLGYPVPVVMDGRMEGRGPHGKPRIRMLENVQNGDPVWNCQERAMVRKLYSFIHSFILLG